VCALIESHVFILAFAAGAGQKVLVKVGGGHYGTFAHDDIMGMDRTDLLVALAGSTFFSSKLKNVALDECDVFVSPVRQEQELTEAERRATALLDENTISSLAGAASPVFIRVELPRECRRVAACGADEGVR